MSEAEERYSIVVGKIVEITTIRMDVSKAFDKVDHYLLLKVLHSANFPLAFIEWIADYLAKRKQCIRFYRYKSKIVNVTSSVPQGTVLAPFLFAVFVASLKPIHPTTKMYKFADDITILVSFSKDMNNLSNELLHMEKEIENINNWCQSNKLLLNKDKLVSLTLNPSKSIVIPDIPNAESPTLKFLGITFNNNLSWNSHIQTICKRACQRLNILRILSWHLSKNELLQLYYSCIRSLFDYACPVF